jgi:hypothetical protein
MTTPVQAPSAGGLEPGWSHDEANGYGPCYRRYAPGHGVLRIVARSGYGYAWYLSSKSPSEAFSWPRERFTSPHDAMRDADDQVSQMPPRMFGRLTPGEAQELYRRLARAYDCGRNQGDQALADVRDELFTQLQIQAADPSYHGPDPWKFTRAVREASYGAALQAMAASPHQASWIAMPRHRAVHGPTRLTGLEFPTAAIASDTQSPAGRPAPSRPRSASTAKSAGQPRPRSPQ